MGGKGAGRGPQADRGGALPVRPIRAERGWREQQGPAPRPVGRAWQKSSVRNKWDDACGEDARGDSYKRRSAACVQTARAQTGTQGSLRFQKMLRMSDFCQVGTSRPAHAGAGRLSRGARGWRLKQTVGAHFQCARSARSADGASNRGLRRARSAMRSPAPVLGGYSATASFMRASTTVVTSRCTLFAEKPVVWARAAMASSASSMLSSSWVASMMRLAMRSSSLA